MLSKALVFLIILIVPYLGAEEISCRTAVANRFEHYLQTYGKKPEIVFNLINIQYFLLEREFPNYFTSHFIEYLDYLVKEGKLPKPFNRLQRFWREFGSTQKVEEKRQKYFNKLLAKYINEYITFVKESYQGEPWKAEAESALDTLRELVNTGKLGAHNALTWVLGSHRFRNSPHQYLKYLQEIYGAKTASGVVGYFDFRGNFKEDVTIMFSDEIMKTTEVEQSPSFDLYFASRTEDDRVEVSWAFEIKQLDKIPYSAGAFGNAIRSTVAKAKGFSPYMMKDLSHWDELEEARTENAGIALIIQIPWLEKFEKIETQKGRFVEIGPKGTYRQARGPGKFHEGNIFIDLVKKLGEIKGSDVINRIFITDTNGNEIAYLVHGRNSSEFLTISTIGYDFRFRFGVPGPRSSKEWLIHVH